MKFYISDTHFGHENIVKYDSANGARCFSSIQEHDELLIKNWNSVVTNQDEVYILGDFSWLYARETEEIIKKLNGSKFLVKGNHDRFAKDGACKKLFQGIYDYKMIQDGDKNVVLSHYPIMFWNGQHRKSVHLFGHVHMTDEYDVYKNCLKHINDFFKEKTQNGYTGCPSVVAINVGAMLPHVNYQPRTLNELLNSNEVSD